MKILATAAVFMMLATTAWADEPQKQANDRANSDEPIVLSEAAMDGVTAGYAIAGGDRIAKFADNNSPFPQDSDGLPSASTTSSRWYGTGLSILVFEPSTE